MRSCSGDAHCAHEKRRPCSQFRTVPDNQEVFAEQVTDDSIVIELLEQAEAPDVEMAKSVEAGAQLLCS